MDPIGWGAGTMIAMMAIGVVVLAAIVVGIVFLVRALSRRDVARTREPHAIETLEERFARGDIDREEYEGRRRLLAGRG